ncbi:MAG: phospholipase D-like domain-containing protein [Alphaproteobacteria bacterium]|nr:phospholipase D-like domain-containing protein [Alphaproteobacteria bacterium]
MSLKVGNIEVFMGPHTLGAPDNLEQAIVSFIDDARKTLDIAIQELESQSIAEAIVRARQRGVRVRMVLELDYLMAEKAAKDPFNKQETEKNDTNRELINALWRAKVDARTDYNPAIFHQKFMIRDVRGPNPALLTGSTNFTATGTHKNLNHVVTFKGKTMADVYTEEFEEIWSGTFGVKRERHDKHPSERRVSGVCMKTVFAPDHMPEMEIMKQMLKAKLRIDFAIFTFAQSSGIDDTMAALARGGIKVRGIADARQGNQKWAATHTLPRGRC